MRHGPCFRDIYIVVMGRQTYTRVLSVQMYRKGHLFQIWEVKGNLTFVRTNKS